MINMNISVEDAALLILVGNFCCICSNLDHCRKHSANKYRTLQYDLYIFRNTLRIPAMS